MNALSNVARNTAKRLYGLPRISQTSATLTTLRLPQLPNSEELLRPAFRVSRRSMVMVTQTKATDLTGQKEDSIDIQRDEGANENNFHQVSDALIVTPSCLNRVQTLISQRQAKTDDDKDKSEYFLRIYVDAGGCSGFQYMFELDDDIDEEEDIVIVEADPSSARIVVDKISLGFLKGSKLDYVQEMIKSSFVIIDNPQSESACGCGSSFAVKNFEANPAID